MGGDIKVCRICFRNDSKFYHFDKFDLKKYYEEVTHKPIAKKDKLPKYFCYECASLLHKFHMFKEKCDHGEKVLNNMLWSKPLTHARIAELNRNVYPVNYLMLEVVTVNKKVKTFNCQHGSSHGSQNKHSSQHKQNIPIPKPITVTIPEERKSDELKTEALKEEDAFSEGPYSDGEDKSDPIVPEKVKSEDEIPIKKEDEDAKAKTPAKKGKRNTKPKQTSTRPRRKATKKSKIVDTSDTDSDAGEESAVMSPEPKKNYKFNRSRTGVKSLAFLDSGFWKRSNFNEEDAMIEFHKRAQDKKYLNAPFKCTLCYKGFSQKSMLDRHMPQKHDESIGKVVCRFCKMRFKHQRFLNKHLRRHYNKYECLRCGLICCLENSALFHEEYHSGVKRKCPHCDKEFNHLSTFYTHLRTHRSKHMCSLCGESFVSEFGLHLHRKAKHAGVGTADKAVVNVEDTIYCEVCKMNFETKDAYQNHLAHSAMHTEENKLLGEYLIHEMLEEEERREGRLPDKNDALSARGFARVDYII
ncbi:zinc finger protein pita-like [Ostrinia nubilalis]|uniref:zinc finger protein pita-like n=1 Tax=Ostrinia nubilalis TaxID=29057 RepID=UPI00308250BB